MKFEDFIKLRKVKKVEKDVSLIKPIILTSEIDLKF